MRSTVFSSVVGWLKNADREPIALGASQPGNRVADVFVTAGDDLIAGLKLQAIADNVTAFGRVAREGYLFCGTVQKLADSLFDFLPECRRMTAVSALLLAAPYVLGPHAARIAGRYP